MDRGASRRKRVIFAAPKEFLSPLRRRLPPLNAIRAFESAARCGSFVAAAEELCVTPAAISHQIRSLEEFLGVPLFVRTPGGTAMTPLAAECLTDISGALDVIAKSMQRFQPSDGHASLTITAGPAFSTQWLVPNIQTLRALQPDLDVRIVADLDLSDFDRDAVDVAIRFGRDLPANAMYVEPLIEETVLPMCSPVLATKLKRPGDLANCTLIEDGSLKLIDPNAPDWATWSQQAQIELPAFHSGALKFNQADHALQAAMDGAGVLLGRRVLATPALRCGKLVPFWAPELSTGLWFRLVCKATAIENKGIQSLRQWLLQSICVRDH